MNKITQENVKSFNWEAENYKNIEFVDFTAEGANVETDFSNCTFENTEWYWGMFNIVNFTNCTFNNCVFKGSSFPDCKFVKSELNNCQFIKDNLDSNCSFENTKAYDCKISNTLGFNVIYNNA